MAQSSKVLNKFVDGQIPLDIHCTYIAAILILSITWQRENKRDCFLYNFIFKAWHWYNKYRQTHEELVRYVLYRIVLKWSGKLSKEVHSYVSNNGQPSGDAEFEFIADRIAFEVYGESESLKEVGIIFSACKQYLSSYPGDDSINYNFCSFVSDFIVCEIQYSEPLLLKNK